MALSKEYLYSHFKECYDRAIAAKNSGRLGEAKAAFREAADSLDKLALVSDEELRQKYGELAGKLHAIVNSMVDLPEPQTAPFGGSAPQVNARNNAADANSADQFISFLGRNELKFGFEGVVGLDAAKEAIKKYLINPILRPDAYNYDFLDNQAILLEGPPGTGKTTFAKAVARETGVPFAIVRVGALVNCFIGETGKNIDAVFARLSGFAKSADRPVIAFFDEFDEIAKSRGGDDKVSEAAVPALLRNLDGISANKNVFIIANTNCADLLDPGIKSRFRRVIHVPLPDRDMREALFKSKLRDVEGEYLAELDLDAAASASEGLSGRDITFICDDFKRTLAEVKAGILEKPHLNEVLLSYIGERKRAKI